MSSTFLAVNFAVEFLFKSLSYLYKVVRIIFSAHFLTIRNFRPQFNENFGANWRWKWELSSVSESAIYSENR